MYMYVYVCTCVYTSIYICIYIYIYMEMVPIDVMKINNIDIFVTNIVTVWPAIEQIQYNKIYEDLSFKKYQTIAVQRIDH